MVSSSLGKTDQITSGIAPNTFIVQTIDFIERQLPAWRDDKTRKRVEAEEDLNAQLCKFLNNAAREDFPMATFHNEEKQGAHRRVDISSLPSQHAVEASMYESIYDPYLVIEGKRLPAPSLARKREYLSGYEETSGGIQRFRLGLHGRSHTTAVMVGYVQSNNFHYWRDSVNGWIAASAVAEDDSSCSWSNRDWLQRFSRSTNRLVSRCDSTHNRVDGLGDIQLYHLWVRLHTKRPRKLK